TSIQLLDEWNVAYAILNPLTPGGRQLNPELDAAICAAVNDWQVHEWLDKEPRMRASIIAPLEYPELAVKEIEKRAKDKRFVQVQFSGRPREPMGRPKYWPIYEVAEHYGLKVMSHAFGSGGQPITGAGWPSFYIEDHVGPAQSMQANIISLVGEGVFERFPKLRVVSAENGFGWVPSLMWRMDASYQQFKSEVPHLRRLPSEYISEFCHFCTQPVEEPHRPKDFLKLFEMWPAAADRLMFASDYAHWDSTAPTACCRSSCPRSSSARSSTATPWSCTGWNEVRRRLRRRDPTRRAEDRRGRRPLDRRLQREGRVLRAAQLLPPPGRPVHAGALLGLLAVTAAPTRAARCARGSCGARSRRPCRARCASRARARSSRAPGTAGSTTSAPANPGARPSGSASALTM